MKHLRQGAIIAFISALFFAFCGLLGLFYSIEKRLYDIFLGQRPERERADIVLFLDVDDQAIAMNGVFPWPRSIMAEGLFRLKEFDVAAVIFDIEFIERSPRGLDSIRLDDLPLNFSRTFSEIESATFELINALLENRFSRAEALEHFSDFIADELDDLLATALEVARDNDEYLASAAALLGRTWITLNLRTYPLDDERAPLRAVAEEFLSRPVKAAYDRREFFADILPPIVPLVEGARGAGFTRAFVDADGVRRRIDMVQKIHGHWYLQLALAPLVDFLGNPALELKRNRLILRDARLPSGEIRDIRIPLDAQGRMLLDWPTTSYEDSYTHISFSALTQLERSWREIERLTSRLIGSPNLRFFTSLDDVLLEVPGLLHYARGLFAAANNERDRALAETSEEAFERHLTLRNKAWSELHYFRDLGFPERIEAIGIEVANLHPDQADMIVEESRELGEIAHNLIGFLDNFEMIHEKLSIALRGKLCIIGQTDAGTTDIGVNPFHNEYVNVGTHGVVLDTILSQSFLIWLPARQGVLLCLITPLVIILSTRLSPGRRAVVSFCCALALFLLCFLFFRFTGIFIGPIYLIFSLICATVVCEIVSYIEADKERQFIQKAFSTYVSADVVKEIVADPSRLQLGGAKRHMSAMFTDIKGFSTISEQLAPEALVALLNRYLTTMSDVVLDEKGTIDKYVGDAIVAFFGAPLELPDHALRACRSAISMRHKEEELNKIVLEENLSSLPLLTRIGITTGGMVAGNMGTENKMNYTIMGNTVNLAARLEGANKFYGTFILTSQPTIDETGGHILSRRLDRVRVVGIHEPVQLYELVETMEDATDKQKETIMRFEKALDLYENREWENAAKIFQSVLEISPNDAPSGIFLKRCAAYKENPPPKNWDGVVNLESK
ncbi:MAG: CHASE2 domain-containing protein [Spirochaetaceae bacterium]|nr:CHASE2 domain-containing protein [Spirochaetaceae bacterium]